MTMSVKDNFEQLIKQAQSMQEQMQKAQQELVELQVVGEAGGGMVKVTMNGRHDVTQVNIDKILIADEDKEMIEDLMMAAINDAVRKVEKVSRDKVTSLTNNIKVPDDLSNLFGTKEE